MTEEAILWIVAAILVLLIGGALVTWITVAQVRGILTKIREDEERDRKELEEQAGNRE